MNWKTFILICALLFEALAVGRAAEPMTYREIAMLLRNGENQQFILNEAARRKLLQPLSAEEEQALLALHALPAFVQYLRDPALVASKDAAAAYATHLRQQKELAEMEEREKQLLAQREAANAQIAAQGVKVKTEGNTVMVGDPAGGGANGGSVGKLLKLNFDAADGTKVDLAKLQGKVVLIDFWATWCGPCMREVPNVVAAYKKYHDRGFEIVGISLDQSKESMMKVAAAKGMTWPQYFDGKGWGNEISTAYHIKSIPTMWLVGKNGLVATTEARGNLEGEIERLLKE